MQYACEYALCMKTLQVRNVPDELHTTLKVRAAQAGMSLSDYLLSELRRMAEKPTRAEVLARLRSRPAGRASVDAARLVRDEREAR